MAVGQFPTGGGLPSQSGHTGEFLTTNGSVASWGAVSGGGTVTHTGGALTSNAIVLGAGSGDTKVSTGITTNGTAQLVLGVNTTTIGSIKLFGNTSGDATISPAAVAGTATAITLPAASGTLATLAGTETFTNKTLTGPVMTAPVLGTPASGNLSNCTAYPTASLTGLGTGVATFLATPSSANLATAITDETGTGVLVFGTSPAITTSLTTGSTTFALLNTTATTVNAFGAATTLNIGASATCILNFGGSTTASEFRFLEPSGSGTNYSAFKAVAQGANITYSLPATVGAAGTFLRDNAGNGVLDWATPAGSGTITSGTTNTLPKYTASTTVGNSLLSDDGTTLTYTGTGGIASGGSGAGTIVLTEGTAPSGAAANTLQIHAPVDITTAYDVVLPAASATGFILGTDASNVNTWSFVGSTGSGNVVRATSATLVTPALGVATATSINGLTITTSTGTLTVTNAKTIGFSNSMSFAGTDSTTMTFPPVSASIGYLNIPQNSKSADYTLVLADAGTSTDHPSTDANSRTFTIPANASVAYPIGTALSFSNMSTNSISIAITTDTMNLAGAGTAGTRTLAQYGVAMARKVASTVWLISGINLT